MRAVGRLLLARPAPGVVTRPVAAKQLPAARWGRWSSGVVEMSDEEKEELEIKANMEKMLTDVAITQNAGGLANIPDLDANLPANPSELQALDHTPDYVLDREVIIYQKSKNSMSSGVGKTFGWTLKFPEQQRWSNPLTGWTSSADPMTSVELVFDTKEMAIAYVEKKGLTYRVKEAKPRRKAYGTNYYAHNFLPAATEAIINKYGKETTHFENKEDGYSHYFRPLKFHGNGPVRQHGTNMYEPTVGEKK